MSLVHPHVEYICSMWSPYTSKDIAMFENVQKFARKMATHNWGTSYEELLTVDYNNNPHWRREDSS